MPFGPFGSVTLDGVAFTTDPSIYEPLNWRKRQSVHPAIGGAVTIQDFGMFAKDNTLRLGSGQRNVLEGSIVVQLHSRYRARGVFYPLVDWIGNQFQVFMVDFVPVPVLQGRNAPDSAPITLYTYTMELRVVTITKLLGQSP